MKKGVQLTANSEEQANQSLLCANSYTHWRGQCFCLKLDFLHAATANKAFLACLADTCGRISFLAQQLLMNQMLNLGGEKKRYAILCGCQPETSHPGKDYLRSVDVHVEIVGGAAAATLANLGQTRLTIEEFGSESILKCLVTGAASRLLHTNANWLIYRFFYEKLQHV